MGGSYAGIGSRETHPDVLALMVTLGAKLAEAGWTLRSGAAPGADSAFEAGCDQQGGNKEIFIPWNGFGSRRITERGVLLVPAQSQEQAHAIAAKAHPKWAFLKPAVRKLHARNVCQVLGADLEAPVAFVLCWTPNGSGSGGTGQAIRIAREAGVPIFDLGAPGALSALFKHLDGVTLA